MIKIRNFKKDDYSGTVDLIKEFLEYSRKNYSRKVLEFDDFINSKKNSYAKDILKYFTKLKDSFFLVAEDNSKIIGYIVGFLDKNPNLVMKKGGHIRSFFVSEKYRNKGVGGLLFNSLVKEFKNKKCDHLILDVFDGNKKTISIYKKWGFKDNLIRMKKKL